MCVRSELYSSLFRFRQSGHDLFLVQIGCLNLGMGILYVVILLGIVAWWIQSRKEHSNTTGQSDINEPLLVSTNVSPPVPGQGPEIEVR